MRHACTHHLSKKLLCEYFRVQCPKIPSKYFLNQACYQAAGQVCNFVLRRYKFYRIGPWFSCVKAIAVAKEKLHSFFHPLPSYILYIELQLCLFCCTISENNSLHISLYLSLHLTSDICTTWTSFAPEVKHSVLL